MRSRLNSRIVLILKSRGWIQELFSTLISRLKSRIVFNNEIEIKFKNSFR